MTKCNAKSSTGKTTNIPQFIRPICPNWPITWDIYFKKSCHHMFIVHTLSTIKYTGATNREANAPVIWVDIGHFSLD